MNWLCLNSVKQIKTCWINQQPLYHLSSIGHTHTWSGNYMQLLLLQKYFVISLPHHFTCKVNTCTSSATKNQVEWDMLPGCDVCNFDMSRAASKNNDVACTVPSNRSPCHTSTNPAEEETSDELDIELPRFLAQGHLNWLIFPNGFTVWIKSNSWNSKK